MKTLVALLLLAAASTSCFFKNELGCEDALYFDGTVAALYSSELGRSDSTVDLGPIIGLVD